MGRRLRAPRRARPPSGLRGYPGSRDGGAPEVRGHTAAGDRGRAGDRPLAGPGSGPGRGPAVRPSHLHCPARAPHPAVEAGTGEELLDVTSAAILHDVGGGGYTADLAVWEQVTDRGASPAVDPGGGPGPVPLHPARGGFVGWG